MPQYFFAFRSFTDKRQFLSAHRFTLRIQKSLPRMHVRSMAIRDDSIKIKNDAANHSRAIDLEPLIGVALNRAMNVERDRNSQWCRYPTDTQRLDTPPFCPPSWGARQNQDRPAADLEGNQRAQVQPPSRPQKPNYLQGA